MIRIGAALGKEALRQLHRGSDAIAIVGLGQLDRHLDAYGSNFLARDEFQAGQKGSEAAEVVDLGVVVQETLYRAVVVLLEQLTVGLGQIDKPQQQLQLTALTLVPKLCQAFDQIDVPVCQRVCFVAWTFACRLLLSARSLRRLLLRSLLRLRFCHF